MSCHYRVPLPTDPTKHRKVEVKNLGWLVKKIAIWPITYVVAFKNRDTLNRESLNPHGGLLSVHFKNGIVFRSDFESYTVMLEWIEARRNLRGVDIVKP
jgi:hypothetical protein